MNVVFLPATDPADGTFGVIPDRLAGPSQGSVHAIRFPSMVWYNEPVRREAIAQIEALNLTSLVLVGFSKSGLGAWNLARAMPDRVVATVIFDAPVAQERRPKWRAEEFYADDTAWLEDLPCRHVPEFKAALPDPHKLILISGEKFHREMSRLSFLLADTDTAHTFLSRPGLKHHWQSGWIEEGLSIAFAPTIR
jgi:pimeloyl-ACP methyl ester carboxylesterase